MLFDDRPIYVIDTNVLVDYPEIVPYDDVMSPEGSLADTAGAHLVIPSAVIREESSFKTERSGRGKASRAFLRKTRNEFEKHPVHTMGEAYNLDVTCKVGNNDVVVSVLPVHRNFKNCLPFAPSEDDMDGQIILGARTIMALEQKLPVDGSASKEYMLELCGEKSKVTLLTNDNGLAIRAMERGIKTRRYGYKKSKPYTGRRNVVVPSEVLVEFWNSGRIEREVWDEFVPGEKPMVANEFIVMSVEDLSELPTNILTDISSGKHNFRYIGRYDVNEDAIVKLSNIIDPPFKILSDGQAMYAEALLNPDIQAIICTGPAGTGKTYLATAYGIEACQNGEYIDIAVVPCSDLGKTGALPGDLNEKMSLSTGPVRNAIRNWLLKVHPHFKNELVNLRKKRRNLDIFPPENAKESSGQPFKKLSIKDQLDYAVSQVWKQFFCNIPVDNARGRDFYYELVFYDEFQDQNLSQADTLIKRPGEGGKLIITGDIKQIHAPYLDEMNNGIVYASRYLYDSPTFARVSLTSDEVERSGIVKMITKRQQEETEAIQALREKPFEVPTTD